MNKVIIQVENLSKMYWISNKPRGYLTIRDQLLQLPSKLLGRVKDKHEEFWALKDVSFEIEQGDRVGIIGRNGAGKSTLLKLLSRITKPTSGRALIHGRVASLLEVGTGFHPELTGRENIFMNGAILGMNHKEIKSKFDEIVNFAEVEKFIDTPVKRYSSGMYVRLAFAVAAHLEPEILLVDEVLAVGDAQFQKKCLGKMEDVSKQENRTVVFVSHDMGAISKLCKKAILLNKGSVIKIDESKKVISTYFSNINANTSTVVWADLQDAPGYKEVIYCRAINLLNEKSNNLQSIYAEEEIFVEIEYELLQDITGIWVGFSLSSLFGQVIFCSGDNNFNEEQFVRKKGIYKSTCKIPANLLNQGEYFVDLLAHKPGEKVFIDEKQVMKFEVLQKDNRAGYGKQPGVLKPNLEWKLRKIK